MIEKYKKELKEIALLIEDDLREHTKNTSRMNVERIADEYISSSRIEEQIDLLERYTGKLNEKKILEVGSGFGMFTAYLKKFKQIDIVGLEPSTDEYSAAQKVSDRILSLFSLEKGTIVNGFGEKMPFPDNSFDVIYSSNVLEHTSNPEKVIKESIRVLKPGGILQFVIPNYGSFWEGHYALFWIPFMPPSLAKWYVRLRGRKPDYVDTLQFITFFKLRKYLKNFDKKNSIEIITYGEDVFIERMKSLEFSGWGGLGTVKKWVELLKKMKLNIVVAKILLFTKSYNPFVLTVRKK